MSYTPRPWKLETAPGGANDGWQISSENTGCGKGRYVVLASRGPITGEEFAGNARLISSAPEMVDSLRALIEHCEDYAIYLKTLGPEFRNDYLNLKNEINKAAGILRYIDEGE